MNCKICGAFLQPGETVCKNCGTLNENPEPQVPTAEPMPEQQPVENPKDEQPVTKKDNGRFLVVIGVIVGLLATAVIGYLIYNSLTKKNSGNLTPDVVVVEKNEIVNYGNYNFSLSSKYTVTLSDYLYVNQGTWVAKIGYSDNLEFDKITNDNLRAAFESVTDYKINEITSKSYNNLSCFETPVDYTDGAKTLLLLCKRGETGYWYVEVGSGTYTEYPGTSVANEVVTTLTNAKKVEANDYKLKINNVNIKVEETTEDSTNNE